MAEVVTLETRQRGLSDAIRSDKIRPKVIDVLSRLAGGSESPIRIRQAREEFITHALRTAKREGLRSWADGVRPASATAMQSLETLLKEKNTVTRGGIYTGTNRGWVLDIWEATLDYYWGDHLLAESEKIAAGMGEFTRSSGATCGVRVFTDEGTTESPTPSLASRILDAYVNRKDGDMLLLLSEIEKLAA